MNSLFDKEILVDKLSKLDSSQKCIETLSHWCIFHRNKAEVVVSTWIEQIQSAEPARKVPLLYLANDILQNSKRTGNEFVTEFWKVLPAAIKDVNENVERGKVIVTRLFSIWQERKVFGSQIQNLTEIMLKGEQPPPLELGKKRSRSIKIVKKDSRSIRTKLSVGGSAEKIVTAFHSVLCDNSGENSEISNCTSAVNHVRKMELDVHDACAQARDPKRKLLANKLEEQENILKQSVEKLKTFEANRLALLTQLREALQEQERELEILRTQIQVGQAQAEVASNMRKQLIDENYVSSKASMNVNSNGGANSKKTAADMAAVLADKLAASSSSQLIMSAVLSTFVAEETKHANLTTPSSLPNQPMPISDPNFHNRPPPPQMSTHQVQPIFAHQQPTLSSPSLTTHPQPQFQLPANGLVQPTMQGPSPTVQSPYQFPPSTPSQQYAQTASGMKNAYGFSGLPPLPHGPPPLMPPQHQPVNVGLTVAQANQPLMQASPQQSGMPAQQQPIPLQGQPSGTQPNFQPLQPHGMVYYTQPYSQ